jgi:threonine dehydrogenase-like Zn-dependent dehydrogenase
MPETTSMWAFSASTPGTIGHFDVPAPQAKDLLPDQVLLKVLAGGICGSDLPFFKGRISPHATAIGEGGPPVTRAGGPLHEVMGEVVASSDDTHEVGSLVVGWASYMNAMSEYIIVNGHDVERFGGGIDPSDAIMLQPLACVLYAVEQLHGIEGKAATVLGQGPIGVLFSHVLKSRGVRHVTGVDLIERSDVAEVFGVDHTYWGSSERWAASPAETTPADIVIEAVGHQVSTLTDAVTGLAHAGQIYYFGVPDDLVYPIPMMAMLRKNARLITGYTPFALRREYVTRAAEHVLRYPEIVGPYLTSRFSFRQAQDAFATAVAPSRGRLKVTLEV